MLVVTSVINNFQLKESTTKEAEGQDIPFQDIYLKDKEGIVCVALWGDMVNRFNLGQLVKIAKCKVKVFNHKKKLSTTPSSSSEVCCTKLQSLYICRTEIGRLVLHVLIARRKVFQMKKFFVPFFYNINVYKIWGSAEHYDISLLSFF